MLIPSMLSGMFPDTVGIDQAERQAIAWSYSGILAGAVADITNQQIYDEILLIKAMVDELWKLQGLDISNPMTVTTTTRTVGTISLAVTGDGETTTTVTRQ